MSCNEHMLLSRRQMLRGAAASLALWGAMPKAIAGTRDPRLLVVVLRGGLDGLSLVAPLADPDYGRIRGALALAKDGPTPALPLDGFFALNPAMPFVHGLYQKRQALAVHAVASPYRGRSHFDGQDVLESGLGGVARAEDGWLNRALAGMSVAGKADPRGLAMGAVVPLVMRGPAPVLSWIPKAYGIQLRDSTVARLLQLYQESDPKLARALSEGLAIDKVGMTADGSAKAPAGPRPFRDFVETAETAAKFLSAADGPRVGALSYNGWDTHANEGVIQGQLATRLAGLDAALKVFAEGMGETWRDTVVLVVTEFGRTAHTNGSAGTDHGTGMAALVLGGAVKGGHVVAKWPGLADKDLFEARDLAPTTDLRAVCKGILRDHLGVPAGALSAKVFPDSQVVGPMDGLLA